MFRLCLLLSFNVMDTKQIRRLALKCQNATHYKEVLNEFAKDEIYTSSRLVVLQIYTEEVCKHITESEKAIILKNYREFVKTSSYNILKRLANSSCILRQIKTSGHVIRLNIYKNAIFSGN